MFIELYRKSSEKEDEICKDIILNIIFNLL